MPEIPLCGSPLDEIATLAVMVRPGDDPRAWMERVETSCYRELLLKLLAEKPNQWATLRTEWMAALLRAERADQILDDLIPDGCNWGAVAGDVLLQLMTLNEHAKRHASVNKAVYITSQDLRDARLGNGKKAPHSRPAVFAAWRNFKTVAHMWAACRLCLDDFPEIKIFGGDLLRFLAIAEWIRNRAGRFLDPDESWRVPDGLSLPSVADAIAIPAPTEWVLRKAREYQARA